MRDNMLEFIENLINEQEKNRLTDKAFIDEVFDNRILRIFRYSLRINKNETGFLKEFNNRMLELVKENEKKIKEESESQISQLKK